MEISSVNFIHFLDLNGTGNAGVQSDGIRPVILCGAETWVVKEEHVKKLEVAEMSTSQ
jgi:hypothetical protein